MDEQKKEFDSLGIPEEFAFAETTDSCNAELSSQSDCGEPAEASAEDEEQRFVCPCCGRAGFTHEPDGSWDICEVCGWEDDPVQLRDPDFAGGANELSLNQARALYAVKNAKERQI